MSLDPEEEIENIYEGRLVHIIGTLTMEEPLTEPDYGIQVLAVKLKRRVQMYQWIEETVEQKFGESVSSIQAEDRTYYYLTDWRDNLVDTRSFYIRPGHENPTKFPIESRVQISEHVHIGKYELGEEIKKRISNYVDLTSDNRPEDPDIKLHSGLYYHCNDVHNPQVGDVRLKFSFSGLEGEYFTIVGKFQNGKIVPHTTSQNGKVLLVFPGELNVMQAFKSEHHSQKLTTWGFRFFGWLILFFATISSAKIINYIFSSNRILAFFAPDMTHPVSSNFILSFSFALFVASFAWVLYRPWFSGGLILAASSPFLYSVRGIAQFQRVN